MDEQQYQINDQILNILRSYKFNDIINFNNDIFKFKRLIRINSFINKDSVKDYKTLLMCDTVKQYRDYYIFLDSIPSIEFEEIDETTEITEK